MKSTVVVANLFPPSTFLLLPEKDECGDTASSLSKNKLRSLQLLVDCVLAGIPWRKTEKERRRRVPSWFGL